MNREYIIYSAGKMSTVVKKYADALRFSIIAFCDKKEKLWGKEHLGLKVISPIELDEIVSKGSIGIIIGSDKYDNEIFLKLQNKYHDKVEIVTFHKIRKKYIDEMLPILRMNATKKYSVDYFEQIRSWINGLMSEVEFWAIDTAAKSGTNHASYISRIEKANGYFYCDRLKKKIGSDSVVVDVGCGVFSQYGCKLKNGEIQLIGVDPLAYFYNAINKKTGVDTWVKFGLFEFLSLFIGEIKADIVLVDNALDHCIDPYKSVIECLKVLKLDGVLSTRHRRCEAIYEGYQGLHKWNVDIDDNGNFLIWNEQNYVNVSKELKEYVSFDTEVQHYDDYDMLVIQMTVKKKLPDDFFDSVYEDKRQLSYVVELCMNKFSDKSMNSDFENMLEKI